MIKTKGLVSTDWVKSVAGMIGKDYGTTMVFTPKQWEILQHRLDCTDAIAEAACEREGVSISFYEMLKHIEEMYPLLLYQDRTQYVYASFDPTNAEQVWLIEELVDGNTMGDMVSDLLMAEKGDPDRREGERLRKHLRAIDEKYAAAGLTARFGI